MLLDRFSQVISNKKWIQHFRVRGERRERSELRDRRTTKKSDILEHFCEKSFEKRSNLQLFVFVHKLNEKAILGNFPPHTPAVFLAWPAERIVVLIPDWWDPYPSTPGKAWNENDLEMETAKANLNKKALTTINDYSASRVDHTMPIAETKPGSGERCVLPNPPRVSRQMSAVHPAETLIFFVRRTDIVGPPPVSSKKQELLQKAIEIVLERSTRGHRTILIDTNPFEGGTSEFLLFGADELDLTDAISMAFRNLQTN